MLLLCNTDRTTWRILVCRASFLFLVYVGFDFGSYLSSKPRFDVHIEIGVWDPKNRARHFASKGRSRGGSTPGTSSESQPISISKNKCVQRFHLNSEPTSTTLDQLAESARHSA